MASTGESKLSTSKWGTIVGKQIPRVKENVCYFVQGHLEHSSKPFPVEVWEEIESFPHLILCEVEEVSCWAHKDSDELFARIRLTPKTHFELTESADWEIDKVDLTSAPVKMPAALDPSAKVTEEAKKNLFRETPGDTPGLMICSDIHGVSWEFGFKDEPDIIVLTTGWAEYLRAKAAMEGDVVMFWRDSLGALRVAIQREKETRALVTRESVIAAASMANKGQTFEMVYYPRNDTPAFVVDAAGSKAAVGYPWVAGVKFTMAFTDDLNSCFRRYHGTVTSVRPFHPETWPKSPWKCLQVWLEAPPHLNVTHVSPWMVEVEKDLQ